MPFASIAGVVYDVRNPGAQENTPEPIGQVRRTHNGGARNSTRTQARSWSMSLVPIPEATYLTLVANTQNNKFVTVNGDFVNNVATLCWVVIKSAPYYRPSVLSGMRRQVELDVYEVDPAIAVATITPVDFILANVDSPDSADPDTYVMTPDGFYAGDSLGGFRALDTVTNTDLNGGGLYPVIYSVTPERSFLSVEMDAGFLAGRPTVRFETSQDPGAYTGTTIFRLMSTQARLYHVRAGVDIGGPWETNYGGPGLGGGEVFLNFNTMIYRTIQAHDRLRLELWSRLALQPGQVDNGQRQAVSIGPVPGPRRRAIFSAAGNLTSF